MATMAPNCWTARDAAPVYSRDGDLPAGAYLLRIKPVLGVVEPMLAVRHYQEQPWA